MNISYITISTASQLLDELKPFIVLDLVVEVVVVPFVVQHTTLDVVRANPFPPILTWTSESDGGCFMLDSYQKNLSLDPLNNVVEHTEHNTLSQSVAKKKKKTL